MSWKRLPEILNEYGIQPDVRYLHQYFIIDEEVLDKVIAVAGIDCRDTVMEIGAGVGNITELLVGEARQVVAYEIDKRFCVFLEPLMRTYPHLTIYFRDIKKGKWPQFDYLIGNVPFNILEPIFPKLMHARLCSAVFVVGERFRSVVLNPPTRESLTRFSVMVHSFFLVEEHGIVEKDKFYPEPNTDAVIVRFIPTKPHTPFLQFCRSLFENQNKLVQHVVPKHEALFQERRGSRRYKGVIPAEIANKRVDRLTNDDFQKLFAVFSG